MTCACLCVAVFPVPCRPQPKYDSSGKQLCELCPRRLTECVRGWLEQLYKHLLHKDEWDVTAIFQWRTAIDSIWSSWRATTSQQPFPKLHMLRHTLEFAERYRFLGRASEAQLESFHHAFNDLFHKQHFNQAHDTPERLRRCLRDAAVRALQRLALGVDENAHLCLLHCLRAAAASLDPSVGVRTVCDCVAASLASG